MQRCLEKPVPARLAQGFRGLLERRFGADEPFGEKGVIGWARTGVCSRLPEVKKIIPDYYQSEVQKLIPVKTLDTEGVWDFAVASPSVWYSA